jgi:hypothetical protein
MREAGGKTGRDRIRTDCSDNRDCARGVVGDLRDVRSAIDDDNIDGEPNQIACHCRQSPKIPVSKPVFDRNVLAVDVAEVSQALSETIEYFRVWPPRKRQDANPKDLSQLLGASTKRLRDRGDTE